jgi:predicted kinase
MIVWIMAQKRTGKSTLARILKPYYENCVIIDDGVRDAVLSNIPQEERPKAIYMACARLAKVLDRQGLNVIVVGGVEKKEWRLELRKIIDFKTIYLYREEVPEKVDFEPLDGWEEHKYLKIANMNLKETVEYSLEYINYNARAKES